MTINYNETNIYGKDGIKIILKNNPEFQNLHHWYT